MTRICLTTTLAAAAIAMAPLALSAQATRTPPATEESQTAMKKEATITLAAATAIAIKEVPGGTIASHELEREDGKLIYSFDIKIAGKTGIEEVHVDAITGAVVAREHEDAAAEAKEKAKDAAAKKAAGTPRKPGAQS